MSRLPALAVVVLVLLGLTGGLAVIVLQAPAEREPPARPLTHGGVHIDLSTPFNYAAIPAGAQIDLSVSVPGSPVVRVSLDGGPALTLGPPYIVDTADWLPGTRVLQVEAVEFGSVVASESFVFFVDPEAAWPPDTIPVDVVLIGFPPSPLLEDRLTAAYQVSRLVGGSTETFDLQFAFEVHAADATYHAALLSYLQDKARYRDDLQARLNLPAAIDQRDNGTPRDIFDPLEGWEIDTDWAELYLEAFPPVLGLDPKGYTLYLLNLSALDDPAQGIDHWFVEETWDPDTGRLQDWWRLEWDNALNTPMGYPLNSWGGPDHTVYVDPTAYQWYLDWTYLWWTGGNGRAPYGFQWEEIPTASRLDYLAGILNDLIANLAVDLPQDPPTDPAALIQNYVLSGSLNLTVDELRWVSSDLALKTYLDSIMPFTAWAVNTTFAPIAAYPDLQAAVDENTTFSGGQGGIDGLAVWNYVFANKAQFVPDQPDVFEVLTVNLLYDNRSMVFAGREFTGLGGSGITTIFLKTDRLFDGNGTRQKGLTSIISHETGHNLGYGHQFGPNYRADFVEGNMGYFRNDLSFGRFWEDALQRLYVREKLRGVLALLDGREPLDLAPEFTAFYRAYRHLAFLDAYESLVLVEAMVTDSIPPVAVAGPDVVVVEDLSITLDGSASSDNFRILDYTWDFGDGTQAIGPNPGVVHNWTDPGTYIVSLGVLDAGGNFHSDTLTVTVLDVTPPTLRILSPESGATLPRSVTIVWEVSDNNPPVESVEVRLDGEAPIPLDGNSSEYAFSALADGPHVVTVTANDAAGNREQDAVSFTVDTGIPTPADLANFWTLAALAVTVVIIGTLVAILLARRANRPPPGGPPFVRRR